MAASKSKPAKSTTAADTGADDAGQTIKLDDAWIDAMVTASAAVSEPGGSSAVVAMAIGKKQKVVLDIAEGRVIGAGADDDVAVTVPTTAAQLATFVDGSESVARAYMQGDLKPVGATGAFLPLVELFEDASFRETLAAALES